MILFNFYRLIWQGAIAEFVNTPGVQFHGVFFLGTDITLFVNSNSIIIGITNEDFHNDKNIERTYSYLHGDFPQMIPSAINS